MSGRPAVLLVVTVVCAFSASVAAEVPSTAVGAGKILFDFEDEADVAAWSNVDVYALREAEAKATYDAAVKAAADPAKVKPYKPLVQHAKEPAVKIAWTTEGATGKGAMKLTYAGGRFPTITTRPPLDDWRPYRTFSADVTASRTCLVVFRVMSETSKYGTGYNEGCSRWEFAARVEAGKNTVITRAPKRLWNYVYNRNVRTVQIYIYQPKEGESITIDNIRLSTEKPKTITPFDDALAVPPARYRVLGTTLEVRDVNALADTLKEKRAKPEDRTVEEVQAEVRAEYEKIRKDHPRAVLAILREGQKGYDPGDREKAFAGWTDAGTPSHGPMALNMGGFANAGRREEIETCFRNRPGFLRCDLSGIPRGAEILAARLIVVRAVEIGDGWKTKPAMFVAEPCNRPWNEYDVNVFEYVHDKFWNQYAGMSWGEDADCTAVFLAHGPSGGKTSSWDFTHAVRWWTTGGHPNHGFILHGAPKYVDYLHVVTREHRDVNKRPAVMVVDEARGHRDRRDRAAEGGCRPRRCHLERREDAFRREAELRHPRPGENARVRRT